MKVLAYVSYVTKLVILTLNWTRQCEMKKVELGNLGHANSQNYFLVAR